MRLQHWSFPDISAQNAAIKMASLLKGMEQRGMWIEYLQQSLPMKDLSYFLRGNLKYADLPKKPNPDSIWCEILIQRGANNYRKTPKNRWEILNENLWWNSTMKRYGKVLYYKSWAEAGVRHVQDLLDKNDYYLMHNSPKNST